MESRDINIFSGKYVSRSITQGPQLQTRVQGQCQHPGMVQASRESREESERYYTCCLEKKSWYSKSDEDSKELRRNVVFVNFAVDRFVLEDIASRTDIPWGLQNSVQFLNLNLKDIQKACHFGGFNGNREFLQQLRKLVPIKRVTFMENTSSREMIEVEDDLIHALCIQIGNNEYTTSERHKRFEFKFQVDWQWKPKEDLPPCASDIKLHDRTDLLKTSEEPSQNHR